MNTSYTYTHQAFGHTVGIWSAEIWETDINQDDNSSIVHVNFYVKAAHGNQISDVYNDSNNAWSEIIIDGERITLQSPSNFDLRYNDLKKVPDGTVYQLGSITKKIYREQDGTKTINVVCHHNCGGTAPNDVYCQGNLTLEKINQKTASILSFDNAIYDLTATINMTISASHSTFKHNLKLSYGGYTEEYTNLSAGSHKITLPSSWRTALIAGKAANILVYCYTYDGDTFIGETNKVLTITNSDSHASLAVPEGVFNIGSSVEFVVITTNDYMSYTIDYNTTEYPTWVLHAIGEKLTAGSHVFKIHEIPWTFKNGLKDQETTTMNVRLRTYHSGELVGTEIKQITIRNDAYILNINGSIGQDAYTENGHYIAGQTRFTVHYNIQSSFELKTVKIDITGANSDFVQIDSPKSSGSWTSNILNDEGKTVIKIIAIDIAGHESSYEIDTVITLDTSVLSIVTLEELNKKVFLKEAKPNAPHNFKIRCAWENNYPIEAIKFEVTGANTFSKTVSAPTGKSYTWETDEVTVAGVNMVNVIIADTNGNVKSSSFSVKSLINEPNIELDGTCVDKTICIGLVDGEVYKDSTRIGVKIQALHVHKLEVIKVFFNEREHQLTNFDGNATTFFVIDEQRIEASGTIPIVVYVKDIRGEEAVVNLSVNSLEVEIGPEIPTVEYEEPEEKVFISEGEKIMFQGFSTDLADYQIVYAVSECDIINATKFCDDIDGGYFNADRIKLRKHCMDHISPNHRFHILKDFGVSGDDTFVFQDPKKKNRFYIRPDDDDNEGFYALQFFPEARPGDAIFIYVRERRRHGNRWLFCDHYHHHHLIPITHFFPVCVIPAAPLSLTIYNVEQTSSKLKIQYKNPLYNEDNTKKDAIHLIDVCLIVKDNAGNILDTQGNRSKSDNRCRDALWGRTWLYFTERKWHNCVPRGTTNYNDKEIFDMEFDISRYPKNANLFVVAFYYADYYRHPSVYSTSNIISINKPTIGVNIEILEPEHESLTMTPNPTFRIRLNKMEDDGVNYTTIYENFNWAKKWNKPMWFKHPIWFRCSRKPHLCMPYFHENHCWRHCHPWHNHWGPKHHIHFFHRHHHCHHHHPHFKIPDLPVNTEPNFKDCATFICANNNKEINLGDVDVDTLLEQGYVDYTWKQENGQFLSIGENKVEVYTHPYKEPVIEDEGPNYHFNPLHHMHHLHWGHHHCHHGHWLCARTFLSMPCMLWNPFSCHHLRPLYDPWDRVEQVILDLRIPYQMLKENRTYTFKFLSHADHGFHYPHKCSIHYHSDLDRLCAARVFIDVEAVGLIGCKWIHDNIIYRPHYHLIETNQESVEINHYGRWMTHTVSFTTPNLSELDKYKKLGHFIRVRVKIRGIHRLKIKDVDLTYEDKIEKMEPGELDLTVKENTTSITLVYPGVITPITPDMPDGYIYHDYINPIKYEEMIELRKYLEAVSQMFAVSSVTPNWRALIRDQSYLMARDYNDIKDYCINLFTTISDKYKTSFKGDVNLFKKLPTLQAGDKRGLKDFSNRGKHYFPEWDDLIDALNAQITKPTIVLGSHISNESATWSTIDNSWIRHNQSTYVRNTEIIEPEPPEIVVPDPIEVSEKSISCATWYRKFWDNPFTNWDNWYPNDAYVQYQECMFHNNWFENHLILSGRETIVREAFYFFGDKLMKLKNANPYGSVTIKFHFIPLKHFGPEVPSGIKFEIYGHPYSSIVTAHGTRNTLCSHAVHLGTAEMLSDGLTMVLKTNMSKLKNDIKGFIVTCSAISHYIEGDFRLRDYCEVTVI